MMTQTDEIEQDRHMNMTFSEFMEALVRVAENLQIPHLKNDPYAYSQIVNSEIPESDKQVYASRPLHEKIECLVYILCHCHFPSKLEKMHKIVSKYKRENTYANDIEVGVIKF